MKTIIKKIDKDNISMTDLTAAAKIIQTGGLVAFPTETVYGLGGDGLREDVAAKIYEAKGRPSDNPLIIHVGDFESLYKLTDKIPGEARILADKFWPGPLTMVLKKKEEVPYGTTGGLDTVAVRMPANSIALELIRLSGTCIAAPSANISGRPSPTLASHVKDDMDDKINMIIDGGKTGIGIESTIIDLTGVTPIILRPGYITKDMLQEVIGQVEMAPEILEKYFPEDRIPRAPGMKYKHYAPKGDLTIFEGEANKVSLQINQKAAQGEALGKKIGIIAAEETKELYTNGIVKVIGSREKEESIAGSLYGILREFDDLGADFIYSESFGEGELGQAIMNRLRKAAAYQVVNCD